MSSYTNNPYEQMSESEKLRIVDELLKNPKCPFTPGSLTKEGKLHLFTKLVEADAVPYTPTQQKTQSETYTPQDNLTLEECEELAKRLPPDQLERLIDIKRAYPGIPLEGLPQNLQREVLELLNSSSRQRISRETTLNPQKYTRTEDIEVPLSYTMEVLAKQPIVVDTGQYQPKYQNRTFADMENQISRDLTNQPNFQAKVKLLSGEHIIKTNNYPPLLSGEQLSERLAQIQAQTRRNYCKHRRQVEQEIRQRQERLRGTQASQQPPPTHYTTDEPPPTHF